MYKGEEKAFKAEEISSMVLIKMKETAQAYLGGDKEVKRAVVTVPAYFVSRGGGVRPFASWRAVSSLSSFQPGCQTLVFVEAH